MYFRYLVYIFLVVFLASCTYFSSDKKANTQAIDTIIDFSRVDVSPSFKACDKLIDDAKTKCFRANMQQQIAKNLKDFSFSTEVLIDETIMVVLLIDNQGSVSLQEIESSDLVRNNIPNLQNYLKKSVESLPNLKPAIKRGIPVNTQYMLPIKIQTD